MTLIDATTHYEHLQVSRCDINLESVKKCSDVGNESISGKKLWRLP